MRLRCLVARTLWPAVLASLALSACSGGDQPTIGPLATGPGGTTFSLAGVTGYHSANAMTTTGYSDRELGPDHYEVRAKGSIVTPPERLEKIALARAAEIGVEQKKKFFRAGAAAHGVICKDARDLVHKSGRVAAEVAPTVAFDVVYEKATTEASFLPSEATFERLSRELAEETFAPDAKAATAAAMQAKCGK
jgi:hypothetical protein